MDNTYLLVVGFVVVIVVYRAFRRNQGAILDATDMQFAKEAIHQGLRCIGYAYKSTCEHDAEALEVGCQRTNLESMNTILAVSVIADGMNAYYVGNKKKDVNFAMKLSLYTSELLGQSYGLEGEAIWDQRATLLENNANARFIFESVTRHGWMSSSEVKRNTSFRKAILSLL